MIVPQNGWLASLFAEAATTEGVTQAEAESKQLSPLSPSSIPSADVRSTAEWPLAQLRFKSVAMHLRNMDHPLDCLPY